MVYYNKTKQTLNQVASSQEILRSVCQYTQKNLMVLPALEPLLYLPRRCQRLEMQQLSEAGNAAASFHVMGAGNSG